MEWCQWFSRRPLCSCRNFLTAVANADAAPFVELLYPRYPQIFFARRIHYTVPSGYNTPDAELELDFLSLCVSVGAVNCVEAMLELGANPNGAEDPADWCVLTSAGSADARPVAPLDCALLTGQEDCALLLEMYGGKQLLNQLGLPEPDFPLELVICKDGL